MYCAKSDLLHRIQKGDGSSFNKGKLRVTGEHVEVWIEQSHQGNKVLK